MSELMLMKSKYNFYQCQISCIHTLDWYQTILVLLKIHHHHLLWKALLTLQLYFYLQHFEESSGEACILLPSKEKQDCLQLHHLSLCFSWVLYHIHLLKQEEGLLLKFLQQIKGQECFLIAFHHEFFDSQLQI